MLNDISYEKELLLSIAQGDEAAFRIIYDRYSNKIFSLAYRLTKDQDLAEDAVQDVFIKLWLNKEKITEWDNFSAYLKTITRNHLYNQMRRMALEESIVQELVHLKKLPENSTASDLRDYHELQQVLQQAINNLTPQQKKVYQLGKEEGMKYEEIAQLMKISRETVKFHMTEALRSIKEQLTHHEKGWLPFILLLCHEIIS